MRDQTISNTTDVVYRDLTDNRFSETSLVQQAHSIAVDVHDVYAAKFRRILRDHTTDGEVDHESVVDALRELLS